MSKRKSTQIDPRLGVIPLGLDIGYGNVKAVTPNQELTFPSVWGAAREIRYNFDSIIAKYPGDFVRDDTGDWFMGDMAMSQLQPAEQRMLRGRTADEETLGHVSRIRLMKTALGKLFPDVRNGEVVHLRIATGLPVNHMRGKDKLKAALIGQHLVDLGDRQFVANVSEVMVMPQPYGGLYSQALTSTGDVNDCYISETTGILDIGRFTVDLLVDRDMEYIDSMSGTAEAGVYLTQDALTMAYERAFDKVPSYRVIEMILRSGCFRINGQPVNFTDELSSAVIPLREAVMNLVSNIWQNASDIDAIYVLGGGAGLVVRDVKAVFAQAELVDNPQFANARGYLYYALAQERP